MLWKEAVPVTGTTSYKTTYITLKLFSLSLNHPINFFLLQNRQDYSYYLLPCSCIDVNYILRVLVGFLLCVCKVKPSFTKGITNSNLLNTNIEPILPMRCSRGSILLFWFHIIILHLLFRPCFQPKNKKNTKFPIFLPW